MKPILAFCLGGAVFAITQLFFASAYHLARLRLLRARKRRIRNWTMTAHQLETMTTKEYRRWALDVASQHGSTDETTTACGECAALMLESSHE